MLPLVAWIAIFVVALIVLLKSADYFTDSAATLGEHFGVPHFIVGVTVVAIGTSLPELASSIAAVLAGSSEIVMANVVGSNIANIGLVLGLAALFAKHRHIKIEHDLIDVDLPMFIGSAVLFAATIIDKRFTITEAFFLLALLVVYIVHLTKRDIEEHEKPRKKRNGFPWIAFTGVIVGAILIYLGAKFSIEGIINIGQILGINPELLGVTAVALGTSLPEAIVSIRAAMRGQGALAVGNVLGSNIFNALAVASIPAFFGAIVVPGQLLTFALPLMLALSLIYLYSALDKKIAHGEALMLVLFYVFFIVKITGLI